MTSRSGLPVLGLRPEYVHLEQGVVLLPRAKGGAYSAWLQTDGRSRSYISAKIFRFQPRCPIEAVAMCLAIDGFQEAVTVTARLDRQAR